MVENETATRYRESLPSDVYCKRSLAKTSSGKYYASTANVYFGIVEKYWCSFNYAPRGPGIFLLCKCRILVCIGLNIVDLLYGRGCWRLSLSPAVLSDVLKRNYSRIVLCGHVEKYSTDRLSYLDLTDTFFGTDVSLSHG